MLFISKYRPEKEGLAEAKKIVKLVEKDFEKKLPKYNRYAIEEVALIRVGYHSFIATR